MKLNPEILQSFLNALSDFSDPDPVRVAEKLKPVLGFHLNSRSIELLANFASSYFNEDVLPQKASAFFLNGLRFPVTAIPCLEILITEFSEREIEVFVEKLLTVPAAFPFFGLASGHILDRGLFISAVKELVADPDLFVTSRLTRVRRYFIDELDITPPDSYEVRVAGDPLVAQLPGGE